MTLEARDLWVAPPGAHDAVVRGVSLAAGAGEWLAVTGPNGCGKSTLALALAGLLPPARGEVRWRGAPLDGGARSRPDAPVVAVLQDPSSQLLQPDVLEELAFTARNLGVADGEAIERARAWAARAGLSSELERVPHELSAGRQQLVVLTAALAAQPALLVADEATVHLDAATRALALDLVAAEVARGLVVVWVTQAPDELARSARVLELGGEPWSGVEAGRVPPDGESLRVALTPGAAAGPRVEVADTMLLTVPARGVLAVVGPNGSGKTMLLETLCGLRSAAGVELAGGPLRTPPLMASQYPEREVFEERVADEVVYASQARGRDRADALAEAAEALAALGYDAARFLAARTWTLSGGEKRLLAVVGALLAPAGLIALDEPTGGLDARRRAMLARLVAQRARQTPVVVATQDLDWAAGLGAAVVSLGRAGRLTTSPSEKTD